MRVFFFYLFLNLFVVFNLYSQRTWDYSWSYSTTMQHYSNKAALKIRTSPHDSLRTKRTGKYEMFPHAGKTTYDKKEEKVSEFKLQQIAIEALMEVDWEKLGFANAYRARDSVTTELMEKIREGIGYHDSILQRKKYPVNDLAVTWALGLVLGDEIVNKKIFTENLLKKRIIDCSQHLKKTAITDKSNYEKSKDQIRLIDLGVRPYLQHRTALMNNDQGSMEQARHAMSNFLKEFKIK